MSGPSSSPTGGRPNPISGGAESLAALGNLAIETRETFVRKAGAWIRRLWIDENGLAPKGAVQAAWVILCQALKEDKIVPISTGDEFERVFGTLVLHVLYDESRRQRAGKRAHPGAVQLSALEETGFDTLDRKTAPPEEGVIGDEQGRSLLELRAVEDESLRAIALLKMEDLTNDAIVSRLGRPTWYVKRELERIRSILRSYRDDRES